MVVYTRWFIVPATTDSDGRTVPKYLDADADLAYNGDTVSPDVVSTNYPALTQTNPDVSQWYIVQAHGRDNAAWQALNNVSVKGDTRNLATNISDVAAVLNARLPKLERSGEAWARSFRMTLPASQ